MQHNPHEIGQPWQPPGGLYRARQCACSFVCPPLRSKPQTFVNFLKMPLHFQTICWPRPQPQPQIVTCVGTLVMLLMRLLAGGLTAGTASNLLDSRHLKACTQAAQALALNDRLCSRRRLNKRF
eukprot:364185-Chlamydomonas_euryale.AAC.7